MMASLLLASLLSETSRAALVSHQSLNTATGLTLNGDAAITTGSQGKFGEALLLDGTDDSAQVIAGSGISGGTARTVSAWVYQDPGSSGLRTPVALGVNNTGTKWDFDIDNVNGGIEVGIGGGRTIDTGLAGLEIGWMMVVSTLPVNGGAVSTIKTYFNGSVRNNTSTQTTTVNTSNTTFILGSSANASQYFKGRVDDVAIWNVALTADEIKALYDVGASGDLSYPADVFDSLKKVHDAGSGGAAAGGLRWVYASGLVGPAGLSGTPGDFTLILNSTAGTGLRGLPPVTVSWGGAGSPGSPELWDSASNADPTHWNRATVPNLAGPEDAVINGGGIEKDLGLTFSGGSTMTLNSGAFFRINPTSELLLINPKAALVINDGTFESNTNAVTVGGSGSHLEVVSGSFVFNSQSTFAFGLNGGGTAIVRSGGVIESTTFFNSQNSSSTPIGGTYVIDGGTLRASGPQADPIRAAYGLDGGGYNFTGVGGTIQIDDFTGVGSLTAYLEGLATSGFFKINGTTVSGFGPANEASGFYLALTDNGTSGSLVLTAASGGFASWIGGFPVGSENGLNDNPDHGRLPNGIEYLLGGNPTIANDTALPVVSTDATDIVLTFDRHDQSIGFLDVVVEVSTDLQNWPQGDWIVIGADTGSSGAGVTITDEGATDAIEVRIPRSGDSEKFARIRVSLPAP